MQFFHFQVHELPPEKLKFREVIFIDIGSDPVNPNDYKTTEDPARFKSEKTGRGPLVGGWVDKVLFDSSNNWSCQCFINKYY